MSAEAGHVQLDAEPTIPSRLAQLQIRLAGRLKLGPYSRSMRYGLCRDLQIPAQPPSAKIPIRVRPLVASDLARLLSVDPTRNDAHDRLEIAWRQAFVEKGARNCFVAVDLRNEMPCYMQWLLSPADNDFIAGLGGFPALREGEALLENAYTPAGYRGLGIMSAAMARIAERAADFGARFVLTFVDQHNVASLKGCVRAGFHPHLLHHRTQLGFGLIKQDRFEELSEADPRRTAKF